LRKSRNSSRSCTLWRYFALDGGAHLNHVVAVSESEIRLNAVSHWHVLSDHQVAGNAAERADLRPLACGTREKNYPPRGQVIHHFGTAAILFRSENYSLGSTITSRWAG
jgi:hypothetical protein